MDIHEALISDKDRWNEFVRDNGGGSFLQSWEWSEFMAAQKERVWRLVVENGEEWLAVIFLFKQKLRLGQAMLYAPRGPVIRADHDAARDDIMDVIVKKVDRLSAENKVLDFFIDPYSEEVDWCRLFDRLGFVKAEKDIQPRHTLILDIRSTEEGILKQMHQKTRYNIGLARKKGVNIIVDNEKFKEFYELLKKTEERQGVKFFDQNYFKQILKLPFAKLYLAEFEGKMIAANIMIFWGKVATYLFGASDYDFRETMSPYLLQWRSILDAKAAGMWFYDFWGAAPKDAAGREANWFGFTKFKMGFSPDAEITEYVGTYEKIYSPAKLGVYRYIQKMFK